jgi:hypothetical protein
MFLLSLFNTLAQTFAALVIFIAGYLALLLCAVAGIVLAHLIYKGARLLWSHVDTLHGSFDSVLPKVAGAARMVLSHAGILLPPRHEGSNRVVLARRSSF